MSGSIRFYFDFASPYAYICLDAAERAASEAGRTLEWRPFLAWAVFKAHGLPAPMETPAKRAYLLNDMRRSAAFFNKPYRDPIRLPLSSHAAARLWHVLAARDADLAGDFGQHVFHAFFVARRDIADPEVLRSICFEIGLDAAEADAALNDPRGRSLLEHSVAGAIADGVCGSPYFIVDGEGFFGADRLPQLRWRLGLQPS